MWEIFTFLPHGHEEPNVVQMPRPAVVRLGGVEQVGVRPVAAVVKPKLETIHISHWDLFQKKVK